MKHRRKTIFVSTLFALFFAFGIQKTLFRNSEVLYEDINQNGIWDDMEPVIEELSTNETERKAAMFYVEYLQTAILRPEIGTKMRNGSIEDQEFLSKPGACLDRIFDQDPYARLRDGILSSKARVRAYLKYNSNLSGGMYRLWDERTKGNPCPFD